jgi:hypothetical protein
VSFALIMAHHHASSFHHTGQWYIVLPLFAAGIGRRYGAGGAGVEAADSSAALIINDEQGGQQGPGDR